MPEKQRTKSMKVLVAIDNSECSAAAISAIADRSWPPATTFEIVTVIEPLAAQYCFAGAPAISTIVEAERQIWDHCQKMIDDKVAHLGVIFGHGRVKGKVIEGCIAESIVDHARETNSDLIVVGSHGRTGIKRFLLGSVAARVASLSPCSIEIVKEKQASTAPINANCDEEEKRLKAHH